MLLFFFIFLSIWVFNNKIGKVLFLGIKNSFGRKGVYNFLNLKEDI